MSVHALTWERFCAEFRPKRNHLVRECAYGSKLYGAFGKELDFVQQQPDEYLFVLHMQQHYPNSRPEPTISSVVGLGSTIEPLGYFVTSRPVLASPHLQSYYVVTFSEDELEDNGFMQPAPPEHITMNYDEWVETYKPLQNPFNDDASLDGSMFETYGDELDAVKKADPAYVWTYVTDDHGENIIVSGGQFVNRLGFIITDIPCPLYQTYTIELDDIWELAASYISNYLIAGEDDDTRWFILQCQQRGELAAAAIHLLHTDMKGQYDPIRLTNLINNWSLEERYG